MPQTPFDSEWVSKGGFSMHFELMTVKDAKDSLQGVVLAISAKTENVFSITQSTWQSLSLTHGDDIRQNDDSF